MTNGQLIARLLHSDLDAPVFIKIPEYKVPDGVFYLSLVEVGEKKCELTHGPDGYYIALYPDEEDY